jgi:hypothetical protein
MRALYVSVAVGEAGRSLAALAEILGQAERNNRRDQITGVIALHDGCFLQAAEGARSDLDRLLERVRRDARHREVRLLAFEPIAERAFPNWAMARVEVGGEPALAAGRGLDGLMAEDALAVLQRAASRLRLAA